eukprot:GEMP01085749.1.p1 GENE.GEMP01085749.1~~GEMP01085749.1.p1  ORF type:complete len:122 (+),score=12.48 GEMP01085749.1:105-470(+)
MISEGVILSVFGAASLMSVPKSSLYNGRSLLKSQFGFLYGNFSRGVFYVVCGIHTFPMVAFLHEDWMKVVFRVLSCVCAGCGVLLMLIGCSCSSDESLEEQGLKKETYPNPNSIGGSSRSL